jgi:hypothetical protein
MLLNRHTQRRAPERSRLAIPKQCLHGSKRGNHGAAAPHQQLRNQFLAQSQCRRLVCGRRHVLSLAKRRDGLFLAKLTNAASQ